MADERGAFRHAVGNGVGEIDFPQEGLHFGVERGTSHHNFDEIPAEHLHGLLTDLFLDFVADDGQVQQQLAQPVVHLRQNVLLENLLHDERHAGNDPRTDDGKRFGNDFRTRHAGEEPQVCAHGDAVKKIEHQSEDMSQRKHGHDTVARLQSHLVMDVYDVGKDAPVGQHHPFGIARSARGVVDDSQFFRLFPAVGHLFGTETAGIFLAEFLVQVLTGIRELFRA